MWRRHRMVARVGGARSELEPSPTFIPAGNPAELAILALNPGSLIPDATPQGYPRRPSHPPASDMTRERSARESIAMPHWGIRVSPANGRSPGNGGEPRRSARFAGKRAGVHPSSLSLSALLPTSLPWQRGHDVRLCIRSAHSAAGQGHRRGAGARANGIGNVDGPGRRSGVCSGCFAFCAPVSTESPLIGPRASR